MKLLILTCLLLTECAPAYADCLKTVFAHKLKYANDFRRHKITPSQYVHALEWELGGLKSLQRSRKVKCSSADFTAARASLRQEIDEVKGR